MRHRRKRSKYHGKSGAGLLFVCLEDKTVLLAKRADKNVNEPGTWGIPGGKRNKSDSSALYTAIRESFEEFTTLPEIEKILKKTIFKDKGFRYTTYFCLVTRKDKDNWAPKLNWEHKKVKRFTIDKLPKKLHFGIDKIKDNIKELVYDT